jgi:hypothetical protein
MNMLAKIGLGACVVFGVLLGGYYLMDLRANEAARLAAQIGGLFDWLRKRG